MGAISLEDCPSIAPLSCGKGVYVVVLLHGLGADGNALIDLGRGWAPSMIKAEFLAPHAPFPYDSGSPGRQWFSVQDRTPEVMFAGARTAAPMLDAFLDEVLAKRRLTDRHLALVGFSQGAMMALHVGLRRPNPPACIAALSGRLLGAGHLPDEIRSKPPVLLVHGDQDPAVPYAEMGLAKAALKDLGVPVKSYTRRGVGHVIDDDAADAVGEFLAAHLTAPKPGAKQSDDHGH